MPTVSGHTTAIRASKVKGAAVHNSAGDKIGHVEDVILDKQSNQIMCAAPGFGGFLGMGEKYAPVPWPVLNYSEDKDGYVVPMSDDEIKKAPASDMRDLVQADGAMGGIREATYTYYKVPRYWN